MTKEQVTDLILKIANLHAAKHSFGIYDKDDIIQESYIICVDALNRYIEGQPLENFLRVNLCNRLKNLYTKMTIRELSMEDIGETPLELLTIVDNVDDFEIYEIIDSKLEPEYRGDYLKWKSNVKISKAKERNLVNRLKEILEEYYHGTTDTNRDS